MQFKKLTEENKDLIEKHLIAEELVVPYLLDLNGIRVSEFVFKCFEKDRKYFHDVGKKAFSLTQKDYGAYFYNLFDSDDLAAYCAALIRHIEDVKPNSIVLERLKKITKL